MCPLKVQSYQYPWRTVRMKWPNPFGYEGLALSWRMLPSASRAPTQCEPPGLGEWRLSPPAWQRSIPVPKDESLQPLPCGGWGRRKHKLVPRLSYRQWDKQRRSLSYKYQSESFSSSNPNLTAWGTARISACEVWLRHSARIRPEGREVP